MKDFTDALLDAILEQEIPRINKIMSEVTKNAAEDLLQTTIRLLDSYYDNYIPINYVRLYEPKRKLRFKGKTNRKPKPGGKSLYSAIKNMKNDNKGADASLISIGDYYNGWVGGIVFKEDYFDSVMHMYHPDSGISGWNIAENFLFSASDGTGNHPKMQRTVIDGLIAGQANGILDYYLNNYDAKLKKFYEDACKKY